MKFIPSRFSLGPSLGAALAGLALTVGVVSCGGSDAGPAAAAPFPRPYERCVDERVVALRRALDLGHRDDARTLRARLGLRLDTLAGVEAHLLDARLQAMDGRDIEAQNYLEAAREKAPRDPRVGATAVELHAAVGRFETAAAELTRLLELAPRAPETIRAQGVFEICRQGGAERGLARLEEARRLDRDLPFCERPLAQAHLLVGKRRMAAGDAVGALVHARRSVEFDPNEDDAWRFLSEVLAATGDFEGAIDVLTGLGETGAEVVGELASLHKRAGMLALLDKDRPRAVDHFLAARRNGLGDDELGTGVNVLRDEALAEVRRAQESWDLGLVASARSSFERALELDPERIDARYLLGVLCFASEEYAHAARVWREVLDQAQDEELALPDPVHLNLAHALWRAGDRDAAREVLDRYLAEQPSGEHAAATRELLSKIPGSAAGAGG